ncbi:uncharacterized protein Dana_GF14735 [Drosophila ananassae]|uniref:Iris n=1 Tax=Drosophila ananassae TaxID=7217 RepID=B3MN92_DROAN|nr:uncharacterized protein LOC6497555 [Drosophila ananassae]EDV31049.2 uncharacterized protein Dana_GF14735 [Drosophila ananassae]
MPSTKWRYFFIAIFIELSHQQVINYEMDDKPMSFRGFNNDLGALVEYEGRAALAMEDWTIIATFNLSKHLEAIKWLQGHKLYASPKNVLPDLDKFKEATLLNGFIQNMDTLDFPLSPSPKEIAELYKNYTSVISSTVNILHGSSFQSIIDDLEFDIWAYNDKKGPSEMPKGASLDFSFLADHIRLSEAAIQEALMSAYQGQLSPRVLTLQQFEKEILNIQAHLPSRRGLFFEHFTMSDIYRIVKISTFRRDNHIVFKILVPLVDVEQFNLYRLTPIPRVLENDKIELVDMEVPYLGINDHLDRHFPLQDLRDCTEMMPEKFICRRIQITYGKDDARTPCSLAAIRNNTPDDCETRQKDGRSLWTPLLAANSWMVALSQELTLIGVCSDDRQELKINGSGILQIRSDCIVKSQDIKLQGNSLKGHPSLASYAYLFLQRNKSVPNDPYDNFYQLRDIINHLKIQQDNLYQNEGVKIAIIAVCPLVVLIVLLTSLAWFYRSYRKKINIQKATRVEDPRQGNKNETQTTNLPLLEKESDQ